MVASSRSNHTGKLLEQELAGIHYPFPAGGGGGGGWCGSVGEGGSGKALPGIV